MTAPFICVLVPFVQGPVAVAKVNAVVEFVIVDVVPEIVGQLVVFRVSDSSA